MRTILYCTPLAALALCSSLMLSGMTNAPGPTAAFDHAALHVSDLARSASFYEGLGLRRIADPFKDDRHVWLSIGPQQQLHLIAGGRVNPEADMSVHIALRVPSLPALAARLDQLHVTYYNNRHEPHSVSKRPDGVMQVYLQDPDGYWIELNDAKP